mmetsp:Transcript_2002/g.5060  ORF Transcript_2002/g.5060 Transcript_2002/m.5060 type:complete len:254 (-) Transcript_2002:667-1428(-)
MYALFASLIARRITERGRRPNVVHARAHRATPTRPNAKTQEPRRPRRKTRTAAGCATAARRELHTRRSHAARLEALQHGVRLAGGPRDARLRVVLHGLLPREPFLGLLLPLRRLDDHFQLLAPQHLLHTNLLRRLAPLLAVEAEARARAADAEDAADEKDPNDSATDDDDLRAAIVEDLSLGDVAQQLALVEAHVVKVGQRVLGVEAPRVPPHLPKRTFVLGAPKEEQAALVGLPLEAKVALVAGGHVGAGLE